MEPSAPITIMQTWPVALMRAQHCIVRILLRFHHPLAHYAPQAVSDCFLQQSWL